jgi:hypothetical protein
MNNKHSNKKLDDNHLSNNENFGKNNNTKENNNMDISPKNIDPYIGPRSYKNERDDQIRFFGRISESDDITSMILGHRLCLVYSASGVGKTSIFNAKIIPTLDDEYKFEVLPMARVGIVTSDEEMRQIEDLPEFNQTRLKETQTLTSPTPQPTETLDTPISPINIFIFNALQSLKNNKENDKTFPLNTTLSSFLKENLQIK